MPNNGRYTMCPFYVNENKKTVSCEDVCRSFNDMDEKWQWMAMYCDNDWMSCPFAADLNEAYYRQEKGDAMALQEHEIKALKSENRSLATKLGMAEGKIERLEKKLESEKELNKSWQRKHEEDEKKKKMFFSRMREAQEARLELEKNVYEELKALEKTCGDRIKYLMSLTGGTFEEADVKKWCEENSNLELFGNVSEEGKITWELKEVEAEEDGSEDIPEEE